MHAMCHTPNNYNIITGRQAGGEAWPPATIRYHDIVVELHMISWYKKFLIRVLIRIRINLEIQTRMTG